MTWVVASLVWVCLVGMAWSILKIQEGVKGPYGKLFLLMVLLFCGQAQVILAVTGIRWWMYG